MWDFRRVRLALLASSISLALPRILAAAPSGNEERLNTSLKLEWPPFLGRTTPLQDPPTQAKSRLARTRATQLARAANHYGRFTGRYPASLDDLLVRPPDLEDDIFYPEGGFSLSESIPVDPWGNPFELVLDEANSLVAVRSQGDEDHDPILVGLAPRSRRPVGAPSVRLRHYYSARVTLHLIADAIRAYRDTHGRLPRSVDELRQAPAPWLPPDERLLDPWDRPYAFRFLSDSVEVSVVDAGEKRLKVGSLTPLELDSLEKTSRPRFTAEEQRIFERTLAGLASEDPIVREGARGVLRKWGTGAIPLLIERRAATDDPQRRDAIDAMLGELPKAPLPWVQELGPLTLTVLQEEAVPQEFPLEDESDLPLLDLHRLDIYLRGSTLFFSGDFEADSSGGGGLSVRAPLPTLSRDLIGLPRNALGLFADITVSSIDRDLGPLATDTDGSLFLAGIGVDWAVVDASTALVRIRAAAQLVSFDDVTGLDDGAAFAPGLLLGINLHRNVTLAVTPEVSIGHGGDSIFLAHGGILIRF